MNKYKQRIKIAEACGWTKIKGTSGVTPGGEKLLSYLPDYLSDLNDMHEAEWVLNDEQCQRYEGWLELLVMRHGGAEMRDEIGECRGYVFNAPAAIRAEAFLRTLNLWEDDNAD